MTTENSSITQFCPKCESELEKLSWEENDETIFVDDCPNCSYRKQF